MPMPMPVRLSSLRSRFATALVQACAALAGCGGEDLRTPFAVSDKAIGKQLVTRYRCGSCRRIKDVTGAAGEAGPDLKQFGRKSCIAGGIPNQPDRLVAWLPDPPVLKPGTPMPAMGLTAQEARHMAACLYSPR